MVSTSVPWSQRAHAVQFRSGSDNRALWCVRPVAPLPYPADVVAPLLLTITRLSDPPLHSTASARCGRFPASLGMATRRLRFAPSSPGRRLVPRRLRPRLVPRRGAASLVAPRLASAARRSSHAVAADTGPQSASDQHVSRQPRAAGTPRAGSPATPAALATPTPTPDTPLDRGGGGGVRFGLPRNPLSLDNLSEWGTLCGVPWLLVLDPLRGFPNMTRTSADRSRLFTLSRILTGILVLLIAVVAGCAITGSKLVLTVDHTMTPCLPTPGPDPCPGD